jgi:hypothetical protein
MGSTSPKVNDTGSGVIPEHWPRRRFIRQGCRVSTARTLARGRVWQSWGLMVRRGLWGRMGHMPRVGLAGLAVIAAAGTLVAPVALASTSHAFRAHYTGHGAGKVSGTRASGSATLTGRGRIIGPSTLHGSAHGLVVSRTCVVFSGKAVLKGRRGSIKLATRRARACGTRANEVSFSGTARITGGSATFAGAHGKLSFTGTYLRPSGAVTISFRGRISF